MSNFVAFRLLLLSLLLLTVVYGMYYMRTNGLRQLQVVFDESHQQQDTAEKILRSHLNWCDTRVQSLQFKDELKIEEDRLEWFRTLPDRKKIVSSKVEEWFGRNCTLKVTMKEYHTVEAEDLSPILRVTFINGTSGTFFVTDDQTYGWRGERFDSEQLTAALKDLIAIIQTKSP